MKTSIIHTSVLLACLCLRADVPPPNETRVGVHPPNETARDQIARPSRATSIALDKATLQVQPRALESAQNSDLALAVEEVIQPFHQAGEALHNAFETRLNAITAPSRTLAKPLIIRSGTDDPASLTTLQDDLAVMTRVLQKHVTGKAARPEHEWALGIAVSTLGEKPRPQSLYLDGYGAVFFFNVNFPLVPPPATEKGADTKPVDLNSEWEQAKEELQGAEGPFRSLHPRPGKPLTARVPFEAERVDSLKRKLIKGLQNAANIRHLKPDQWITVAVTGGESGAAVEVREKASIRKRAPYGSRAPGTEANAPAEGDEPEDSSQHRPKMKTESNVFIWNTDRSHHRQGSILTLRVRKADVDALAAGQLTSDEFEQKVAVAAY